MTKITIDSHPFESLVDNEENIKEEANNIYAIKIAHQQMAENLAKAVLAPLICKFNISEVQLLVSPENKADDDGFVGNIMNLIDGINGYDSTDEISSVDGTEEISYSELQEEISNTLEKVYSLLTDDVTIDVNELRKEYLNSKILNQLPEKTTKPKANKI